MDIDNLFCILLTDKPSELIKNYEDEIFKLIPELKPCKGFNQHNSWHNYDVYDHILNVVDNTPDDLIIRISALFHDIGKPVTYTMDSKGRGHFPNHWLISQQIFEGFAKRNGIYEEIVDIVSRLILYHDIDIGTLNNRELMFLTSVFNYDEMKMLFALKKADLLGHDKKVHYLLDRYNNQENKVLNMYKEGEKNEYAISKRSKKKNQ